MTAVRSDRTRGTRWVETIALFTTGLYAKSSLIPSRIDEIRRLQCAGMNRREAGEEETPRERSSDPLGPEFCVGYLEVHSEA